MMVEPVPTPESAPYWEGAAAGELRLPFCTDCGRFFFYPRTICPRCSGSAIEWRTASGRARLASFVISARPIPGVREEAPFVIALVELEEGPRLMTDLVDVEPDPEHLALDQPLQVAFEPRGEMTVPVFRPVPREES
jgi:hypothetical protein